MVELVKFIFYTKLLNNVSAKSSRPTLTNHVV